MKKNPSLKKCGYEHQVQMTNDTFFSVELNGAKDTIRVNLDESVLSIVTFMDVDLGKHDFVNVSLLFDEKVSNKYKRLIYMSVISTCPMQILHCQTMLLYDKLRVDEESPAYQVTEPPPPDLSKIEIDENIFGKISNIEPLLASIRNGE